MGRSMSLDSRKEQKVSEKGKKVSVFSANQAQNVSNSTGLYLESAANSFTNSIRSGSNAVQLRSLLEAPETPLLSEREGTAQRQPVQFASGRRKGAGRIDQKKKRWKEGKGKKNWKHARKLENDKKHLFEEDLETDSEEITFEEEEGSEDHSEEVENDTPPKAVVSEIFSDEGFSELNYLSAVDVLQGFYWVGDLPQDIVDIIAAKEPDTPPDTIIKQHITTLLENPRIKAVVASAGNCGEMANFLFGESQPHKGDYPQFLEELRADLEPEKVKLIKVSANIGHAFTLICYRQGETETVELIQAWQGEYPVGKSLMQEDGNIYLKEQIIHLFEQMHANLAAGDGLKAYQKLFMLPSSKQKNFDVTHLDVKILDESPEDYAHRLLEKKP